MTSGKPISGYKKKKRGVLKPVALLFLSIALIASLFFLNEIESAFTSIKLCFSEDSAVPPQRTALVMPREKESVPAVSIPPAEAAVDSSEEQQEDEAVEKQDSLKTTSVPPAPPVDIPVEGLTFGSCKILNTCWSPRELRGSAKDKTIVKLVAPDNSGPHGIFPYFKNPPLSPSEQNSIRSVKPFNDQKIVALTFDLCERAGEVTGYDADIVNYLRDNGIKATFFTGGKWMASHKEKTMQLMADPLFEIGNHAWTHGNMRVLSNDRMEEQIVRTQVQYELLWNELKEKPRVDPVEMEKIPKAPMLFRFPYGTCNSAALRALASHGLPAIQWDVVTGDPASGQTARGIAGIVLNQTRPGSIIICHANGRGHGTADALPLFMPQLKQQGYRFVTVSELLRMGRIVSKEECYELKPNDNLHYDRMFGEGTQ